MDDFPVFDATEAIVPRLLIAEPGKNVYFSYFLRIILLGFLISAFFSLG